MRNSDAEGCGCIIYAVFGAVYILLSFAMYSSSIIETMDDSQNRFMWIVFGAATVVSALSIYYLNKQLNVKKVEIDKLRDELSQKRHLLSNIEIELSKLKKLLSDREELIKSKSPFSYVADLYSDFIEAKYTKLEFYLRNKKHPARSASDEVKEVKGELRRLTKENKVLEYKQKFILARFPELSLYYDDEYASCVEVSFNDYGSFRNSVDEVRLWVSDDEYKKLSEIDRNQLAFDRWKKSPKDKPTIGMMYEMYIAHLLSEDVRFFGIERFGIERGLNDLGRDIIARKRLKDGTVQIYIIQCKKWSERIKIHENTICQLFGTAVEYEIMNRDLFGSEIVPLLVTTAELSDTAKKFADRLGVKVKIVEMGDYPMIKCNINNGNKIYHLPFDQQYRNTKIEKDGEFYAWTVKEAHDAEFRRAHRWNVGNVVN